MHESEEMRSKLGNDSLLQSQHEDWAMDLQLLEVQGSSTYLEYTEEDEQPTRQRSKTVFDHRTPLERWMGTQVNIGNVRSLNRLSSNRELDKWAGQAGVLRDINATLACVSFDDDSEEAWFPVACVSKRVTLQDLIKLLEGLEPRPSDPFTDDIGELGDYSNEVQMLPNPETIRQKVWALVEPAYAEKIPTPYLRHAGLAISWFSQFVIVVSVLGILLATLPQYIRGADGTNTTSFLYHVEVACIVYFTVEFILRALSAPSFKRFWTDAFTWIDLISIFPFYLTAVTDISYGKGLQEIRILRVLARITRATRVLKVGRHSMGIRLFVLALKRSWTPLCWHTMTMLIMIVTSGTIMYYVERESCTWDSEKSVWLRDAGYSDSARDSGAPTECTFQSIPGTLWWAAVTLTTVGYGDEVPVTDLGKALASLVMLFSVLVMTFPMVILTTSFNTIYKSYLWARFRHTENERDEDLEQDFVKATTLTNIAHSASRHRQTSVPDTRSVSDTPKKIPSAT